MTGRPAAVALLAGYLLAIALAAAAAARADVGKNTSSGYPRDAQAGVNAIAAEFGPGPTGACFWRIAWRESRLHPDAANWTDRHADGSRGSFGLLGIGALWRRPGETVRHFAQRMFDPEANARLAHRLYDRYGLQPWGNRCG